jgi:hypothetical protein
MNPLLVDECDCEGPFTEAAFRAGENMIDGVSGRKKMDSSWAEYEHSRPTIASVPVDKTY